MKKRLIIILLLAILLIIQLFKIDTKHREININKDFLITTNAPQEINNIIKNSCYDCHSYKTNYPWYSKTAPISWVIQSHIKEGREHLNFSEWGNYSLEKQILLLEECDKEIEKNEMPLKLYTMIHTDSKLSDDSKRSLIQWFNLLIYSDTLKIGK